MKRITSDEAKAAYNLLRQFSAQEQRDRIDRFERERQAIQEAITALDDKPQVVAWARLKAEAERARGIGSAMTEEANLRWTLENLRRSLGDVAAAWGLTPDELMRRLA